MKNRNTEIITILSLIYMEERYLEAHEAVENEDSNSDSKKRIVVVPGEIIVSDEDYLSGEGTRREGTNIVANRFGIVEESGKVIRIIPLFGAFIPRRNNVIVGRITDINRSGWIVDIDSSASGFLPLEESPKFINKNEMDQFLAIGDVIAAKIWSIGPKGIDLTTKGKGLGKLEEGFIFRIIPSRVPRVIGREGSMVTLIKEKTECNITVGQNGWIWVKGQTVEDEILARRAIEFVADKVHLSGLTEKVESWFREQEK